MLPRRLPLVAVAVLLILGGAASPAAAAPAGFTAEPYGTAPVVTEDAEGILIHSDQRPSGMYYRAKLDPTKRYRLSLVGQRLGGRFTVRIRRGSATPEYETAPTGEIVNHITGVSEVEVLLYRWYDSDATDYRIRSLTIAPCDVECPTDAEFKRQLERELTGLQSALQRGDQWEAAKLLMRWAAPRTAFASATDRVATFSRSAAEMYYGYFREARSGVYCGGAAAFLHKLLELFDIPSFELHYGDVAFLTHAIVVVPLPDGTYRILDPTFNAYYKHSQTGRPLSVQQMLESWRAGRIDLVSTDERSLADRPLVADSDGDGEKEVTRCGDRPGQSTGCGLAEFRGPWAPIVEKYGYSTDDAGLVRLLGMEKLYPIYPAELPEGFVQMHAKFRDAVLANDVDVHVADVPLTPEVAEPPAMLGTAQVGDTLNIATGRWIARPGAWTDRGTVTDFDVSWARCNSLGCESLPGDGLTRDVVEADEGHQLTATIRAENEHGTSTYTARSSTILPVPGPAVAAEPTPAPPVTAPAVSAPAEPLSAPIRIGLAKRTLRVRGRRVLLSVRLLQGTAATVRVVLKKRNGRAAALRSATVSVTASRRTSVALTLRGDARRLRTAVVELRHTTAAGRHVTERQHVKLVRYSASRRFYASRDRLTRAQRARARNR
ncbi:MAG: hypothetical protein M3N47_03880 [Chloroflexota bacterium]|nr:hypothetical protein [Chloroflexota bacterium]